MKSILVVDDDPSIRILLTDELTDMGYNVVTAVDGEEALISFEESQVDLIILDLKMPKLEGDEVLKVIGQKSDIPVIVFSANLDSYENLDKLHSNTYFVEKSGDLEKLLSVIKEILND